MKAGAFVQRPRIMNKVGEPNPVLIHPKNREARRGSPLRTMPAVGVFGQKVPGQGIGQTPAARASLGPAGSAFSF